MKLNNYSLALILALPFPLCIWGCSNQSNKDDASSMTNTNAAAMENTNMATGNGTNMGNGTNVDADNSGKNVRDRDGTTLTPGDQGNTPEDRDVTQRVRKALVMDTSYSMTAKNIKIITVSGKVTLRGPVNNEAEKTGVVTIAKNIAGDANVEDQLEVKSNP